MAGDRQVYGSVFIGMSGRGVYQGDPNDAIGHWDNGPMMEVWKG